MAGPDPSKSWWSKTKLPLQRATCSGFPCVVRAGDAKGTDDVTRLPKDSTILLEKKVKVTFVHIKVAEFLSVREASCDYGSEFVIEHDQCIGNEYLIPIDFKGKVYISKTPGGADKFTNVNQVIHDMPKYVTADEDFVTVTEHGCIVVEKEAKLEVLKTAVISQKTFLVCKDEYGRTLNLNANMAVNLSVCHDRKHHTLRELIETHPLPKTVHFLDVSPGDVINCETADCYNHFSKIAGTIQVLGVKVKEVIVGWTGNDLRRGQTKKRSFTCFVIPSEHCDKQPVFLKQFPNKDSVRRYVRRNFPDCRGSNVTEMLYLLSAKTDQLCFVKSPVTDKVFECHTDSDDSDDYVEPISVMTDNAPEIPRRVPRTSTNAPASKPTKENTIDGERAPDVKGEVKEGLANKGRRLPADVPSKDVAMETDDDYFDMSGQTKARPQALGRKTERKDAARSDYTFMDRSLIAPVESGSTPPTVNHGGKTAPQPPKDRDRAPVTEDGLQSSPGKDGQKDGQIVGGGEAVEIPIPQPLLRNKERAPKKAINTPSPKPAQRSGFSEERVPGLSSGVEKVLTDRSHEACVDSMSTDLASEVGDACPDAQPQGPERNAEEEEAPLYDYAYMDRPLPSPKSSSATRPHVQDTSHPVAQLPDYRDQEVLRQETLRSRRLRDRQDSEKMADINKAHRDPLPLPAHTPHGEPQYQYDYAADVSIRRVGSVNGPGQTADDFYSYTVNQLAECLQFCGLNKLAKLCQEQGLDGDFFQRIDEDEFTSQPFNLTKFELTKLRTVITGWRPNK